MKLIVTFGILILFASCASIRFEPSGEETSQSGNTNWKSLVLDEKGNVIVKSGTNRDYRKGYYFDSKEGVCKEVWYSTGTGCVPPPFKTVEECKSCRGVIISSQK